MANLIKCRMCGGEIAEGSVRCTHCGSDQRNFFMQHKVVAGLLTLILLAGFSSALIINKPNENKESTTISADNSTNDESKSFNIGDIIQTKDYKIVVNRAYNLSENKYIKPEEGNEFLAVDCTIENTSKKEQSISSILMFSVSDIEGKKFDYSLTDQIDANIPQLDGKIETGGKLSGTYLVEVPVGKTGLEFNFYNPADNSSHVMIKLN